MKKIILCLAILLFIQSTGKSQWYKLNPHNYSAVDFVDQYTGYLAGVGGVIRKTTDGGQTWNFQNTGTTKNLRTINFINNDIGFCVGLCDILLKTTNGGEDWKQIPVNPNECLSECYFINDSIGFAISSTNIVKSTDGGVTWNTKFTTNDLFYNIKFINASYGYAVGRYSILGTEDGGETWNEQYHNLNVEFASVSIIDSLTCIAVGIEYSPENRGIIYKTTNGGNTWLELNFFNQACLSSFFINDQVGIIGFPGGTLARTTNGGINWSFNNFGFLESIQEIDFTDSINGFASGFNTLVKTTNGGETWFSPTDFPTKNLRSTYFSNIDTGFVVGYSGVIHKTNDGGVNWTKLNSGVTNNLNSITLIDNNNGIIIGDGGRIIKTTDAGSSWVVKGSATSLKLNSICFPTSSIGYIVGSGGKILKTTNSGENWINIVSGVTINLNAVAFFDKDTGIVVGDDSYVLKTTNGGDNWRLTYLMGIPNIYENIYCIDYVNQNTIYAGGCCDGRYNIWKSVNAGDDWVAQTPGLNVIYALSFQSQMIGYALQPHQILFTTNGGNQWTEQQYFSFNYLYSLFMVNEQFGYAVGEEGCIFKTTNGGGVFTVPVELNSFEGNFARVGNVDLFWSTASELNNQGFEIERSTNKNDWIKIGFKEGKGTTTEQQNYSFTDDVNGINVPKLFYRLKQIDFDGSYEYSDIVEVAITPIKFSLSQNYPNPFNPSTKISWQSPVGIHQTLKVYDVLGREVAILVDEYRDAGNYEIEFDGSQLASGVYYYQLRVENFSETRKMQVLK